MAMAQTDSHLSFSKMDLPKENNVPMASASPKVSSASTEAASQMFSSASALNVPQRAPGGVLRAKELKAALYDPSVKLVDLFGDLEPKLMLDQIMETFWEPCFLIIVFTFG